MTFTNRGRSEKGNILFLILLAVVLFAALSYAVTQSMRGGGNDATSEKDKLIASQLQAYPVSVRTAILRMIVGGTSVSSLNFDPPSEWASMDATTEVPYNVFHPSGGGAVFSFVPSDALATPSTTARWVFNRNFGVPVIGTAANTTTDAGKELIAFATDLDATVCAQVNKDISGSATIPEVGTTLPLTISASTMQSVQEYTYAQAFGVNITATANALDGKPYYCVDSSTTATVYTYYHVLVER